MLVFVEIWYRQRTDVAYVVTGLKSSKRSPRLACRLGLDGRLLIYVKHKEPNASLRRPPRTLRRPWSSNLR